MSKLDKLVEQVSMQLSEKTLQLIAKMDKPRSPRTILDELTRKTEDEKMAHINRELELIVQKEEKAIEELRCLLSLLNQDEDYFEKNTSNGDQRIRKRSEYDSRLRSIMKEKTFDVSELESIYSETEKIKEKISKLDEQLSVYKGLPPSVTEARRVIEMLEKDVDRMAMSLVSQISEEAKFGMENSIASK